MGTNPNRHNIETQPPASLIADEALTRQDIWMVSNPFGDPNLSDQPLSVEDNWDAILASIHIERQFWDWLEKVQELNTSQVRSAYTEYIQSPLNRMFNAANELAQFRRISNASKDHRNRANNHLTEFKNALGPYLAGGFASQSPRAQIVSGIRDRYDLQVAAGSFMALADQTLSIVRPTLLQGVTLFVSRLEGWSRESADTAQSILRNAVEHLTEEAEQTLTGIRKANNEIKATADGWLFNSEKVVEESVSNLANVSSDLVEKAGEAIKKIDDTRAAYIERMHLEAPVQYWKKAAELHKRRHIWALGLLVVFLVAAGLGGYWYFWFIFQTASALSVENHLVSLVLGGATLALATVAIWTIRVLVRIFLSEKHMWSDAEERSTMVQTYLALVNEGKLSENERVLVLQPVFRNMADGLVKDDGVPSIGPAVWLTGKSGI